MVFDAKSFAIRLRFGLSSRPVGGERVVEFERANAVRFRVRLGFFVVRRDDVDVHAVVFSKHDARVGERLGVAFGDVAQNALASREVGDAFARAQVSHRVHATRAHAHALSLKVTLDVDGGEWRPPFVERDVHAVGKRVSHGRAHRRPA